MSMTAPPHANSEKAPGRGFWAARDLPTAIWLMLTVIAVILHRELPSPRWLMIHLFLLGAITHAIMVWSQYFSYALLRRSASVRDRRRQSIRLLLSNGGAALVFFGVPLGIWPLSIAGAVLLIVAVSWHGASLYIRARSSMPGRFGRTIRFYIVAAAMLVVGAGLGGWLARGGAPSNLVLAHALLNVLGWIGIVVAGTLVTLWPTILRTRADERAPQSAARSLPLLAAGVLVAAGGAAAGWLPVMAAGLAAYFTGLVVIGIPLWRAARRTPPKSFAALSVGMAMLWWAGCVAVLIVGTIAVSIEGSGVTGLAPLFDQTVPFVVAGFAAQVLPGALSYLVPVVLGGGPTPVRVGTAAFDRFGALRVAAANTALLVCVLPVSSLMRVAASMLYLIAIGSFLIIMFVAMRAQRRAKVEGRTLKEKRRGPLMPEGERPAGHRAGQAVAGLLAVVLTVAVCAVVDPVGLGWGATAGGDPDAPVQVVQVEAADMRFTPSTIEVPVGTRLVIELHNADDELVHDLVFANGTGGTRLSPGESERIDVGVITEDLDGWCSIIGHRQMGMTLAIVATGAPGGEADPDAGHHHGDGADASGDTGMDSAMGMGAEPGPDFAPYDAVLPPLPPAAGPTTHKITLTVEDTVTEVAPGIEQTLWTYNGTAPGPTLHGRIGDTFEVTLVNAATMGHSIDFHAGALAPDEPMRTIAPGESLTYAFTATRSGIWMYHCSTMPMTAHIANGMFGAVVIEPDDLPLVDRSYVLVQNEYYLGAAGGEVDVDTLAAEAPDLVVFNGYANQYDHAPLPATTGERVRVWLLDAGPNRATSFHIVGGQFDTVWTEGRYLIDHAVGTGSQALALQPAQGGFVELAFPEAGHYPFVSHIMIDAERGAHGTFEVTD
jgi:nitrite reductase (NO-forming)